MIESGIRESEPITTQMRKVLARSSSIEIEYVSIVDAETLQSIDKIAGKVLVAVAVRIGSTRLIDNIVIDLGEQ